MDKEYNLYEITRENQSETTMIVAENFSDVMKDIEIMCKEDSDLRLKKVEKMFDFIYISNSICKSFKN